MVTNTYTPIVGGVERSIMSFTSEFKKFGHEVLIVTLEFDNMPDKEQGVVRIPAIRHFNGSDFSIRLPIPTHLDKILKVFKPDIVHSHHPFILGDTALRISNEYQIPIVFTHHTRYEDYTHYVPMNSLVMKKFAIELTSGYVDLVDLVIAPSESIRQLLLSRKVKTPIEVVPTGVDYVRFSVGSRIDFRKKNNIKNDDFVIGHVGRLAEEKNLEFLMRCIIPFIKKTYNAKFLLIGKGPSLNFIRNRFIDEKIENRLVYADVLDGQKLVDAYHSMDVFVFSSKTETQGVVLIEAMAAGVPVVALSASGVNDVMIDEENGYVVLGENEDEFISKLDLVYAHDDLTKKAFKQRAQETANALSIDKMALRMLEIYGKLIDNDFVYTDIENSPWVKVLGLIKAEWDLIGNFADAIGFVIKDKLRINHNEGFTQKLKRWLNNNEWTARIAGLSQSRESSESTGIVFIQIDGLGLSQVKNAMKNGKMPFFQKLIRREHYLLHKFYSGQPSSTPGVQAELFYGEKGAVPSFSFLDSKTGEVFRMYDVDAAIEIEKRLAKKSIGLLEGGSSYSNIYSGGAAETHFCSVDLGWDKLWKKIKFKRVLLLILLHMVSILKTILKIILELFSSLFDFIDGLLKGENFFKELKFIPTRIGICVLLRDLTVFGAKIDIIRGLPVIHVNFSGYDEHSHRRGPSSKFAHWTLLGIDHCISKIYRETQRSQRRNYDVWIYSDHGQEETSSYYADHKKSIHQAVQEVFNEFNLQEDFYNYIGEKGEQSQRINYLGNWYTCKFAPFVKQIRNFPPEDKLVVTAMGPVGHIYLPVKLNFTKKNQFALRLIKDAKIPLILSADHTDKIYAWNAEGLFVLPEDSGKVFGNDHPFLSELTADIMVTCRHPSAGAFTILGFKKAGLSVSFPRESGSHGGPGISETTGFALLPADIVYTSQDKAYLRASDLRHAALKFMKKEHFASDIICRPLLRENNNTIRIMTYNVHGCKGMDSKISPQRIARVIALHNPDIVALQELDMNRIRSLEIDQPHTIAKELEMFYHFHPSLEIEEQQYGNAILSKFPIELILAKSLPTIIDKGMETRGAIWVSIDIKGVRLQIMNTHLGLNNREQIKQVNALLGSDWIGSKKYCEPAILIGDFNASSNSNVCKLIKNKFDDAQEQLEGHKPKATWFGHFPLRRIDHVFVSNNIKVKRVHVASTYLDKISSDHLPLIVDIVIDK